MSRRNIRNNTTTQRAGVLQYTLRGINANTITELLPTQPRDPPNIWNTLKLRTSFLHQFRILKDYNQEVFGLFQHFL